MPGTLMRLVADRLSRKFEEQFAAVGRRLYDMALERGLGVKAPIEWFHQDKQYIP